MFDVTRIVVLFTLLTAARPTNVVICSACCVAAGTACFATAWFCPPAYSACAYGLSACVATCARLK